MGQLRPHSNTSELIACSAEPKTLRFVVLFEVPLSHSRAEHRFAEPFDAPATFGRAS